MNTTPLPEEEEGFLSAHPSMAHEGLPIDWAAVDEASEDGRLMDLLVKLPRARWAEQGEEGNTLLHFACCGPNVAAAVALLQSGLVDVNARDECGWTTTHMAAAWKQPRVLEVLCAAGADLRVCDEDDHAPIDCALSNAQKDGGKTVRVLVANGVRLSTARDYRRRFITPEFEAFECGVLRCRSAVVAMLRVKRAGQLWMWDKFLLEEVALCIWATRYDKGWQTAAQQQQEELARDAPSAVVSCLIH